MIVSVAEVVAVIAVIVSAAIVASGLTLEWATRRLAQRREAREAARRAEAAARPTDPAQACEPPTADGIDAVEAELDAIERLVLGDRHQPTKPPATSPDSLLEVEVLRLAEDTVTAAIRITRDAANQRGNR